MKDEYDEQDQPDEILCQLCSADHDFAWTAAVSSSKSRWPLLTAPAASPATKKSAK